MKRILFFICLILLFPTIVLAEEFTIKTKVQLETGTLKGGEFSFVLKDQSGKVVQTKTNDKNGNIVFDSISFDKDNLSYTSYYNYSKELTYETFELRLYTIEEINTDKSPYKTSRKIWVKTVLNNDGTYKVLYLEDPDIDSLLKNIIQYEGNPYHAPADELVGEAYFKIDLTTGEAVIFRDEAGKYTTGTVGNYYYKSDIEHTNSGVSLVPYGLNDVVKSLVIQDPIKPDSCKEMFRGFNNLETIDFSKLDTSNCTSFEYMFSYDEKLKNIDVTTFDFTNISNYGYMFYNCMEAETIKIPHNLDVTGVDQRKFSNMFYNTKKLKYLDIEFLKNVNFKGFGNYMFAGSGLVALDASVIKLDVKRSDDEVLEGVFDNLKSLYYIDLTGIHNDINDSDYIDIDFYTDSLRVIDVGERFYAKDMNVYPGSVAAYLCYSYSIDHNVYDRVIADGYYTSTYAPTGRHLYINDEDEIVLTKVLKPVEPVEVKPVTNPKTGLADNLFLSLLLGSTLFFTYNYIKQRNAFKKI